MLKNDFADRALKAEKEGWDEVKLKELLGAKRERLGIFEGDELRVSLKQAKVQDW